MARPICARIVLAVVASPVFLWAACVAPPSDLGPVDGRSPGDASAADAAVRDGAVRDGSFSIDGRGVPDAAAVPVDAASVDARMYDNPHGIAFADVSFALGDTYLGGRMDPNPWSLGTGAAIGDIDGDDDMDIFLARCDSTSPAGGPSTLLRNNGNSGFPGFVAESALSVAFQGTCAAGAAFGDYDRDGDLDLFVTLRGPDRLYRNNGAGIFSDVTASAGVAGPGDDRNTGAYWVDVTGDGFLDLLVLGQAYISPPTTDPLQANRLYRNLGDGTFADITTAAGAGGDGSSQAAAIGDLDGDGDLEIYVTNDRYAINGTGGVLETDPDQWLDLTGYDQFGVPSYVDRSAEFGTDALRSGMGVALGDVDGDGRDDVYVSDWGPNYLHVWNPMSGAYDNRASDWGVGLEVTTTGHLSISWAAEFVDLDRDGRQELIVINGATIDFGNCASWGQSDIILRRADAPDGFVDITGGTGWPAHRSCPAPVPITEPAWGRGLIVADIDGDGDDDMLVTPYIERYRVYRNITGYSGRHQLRVMPIGTVSAPTPHGAVLRVTRLDGVTVHRTLYAGGTLAQRFPALEVGLAAATAVTSATLTWPSGYEQRLDLTAGFTLDTNWRVTEPEWLILSQRRAAPGQVPVLRYRPTAENGTFLGAAGAGRAVSVTRSDGLVATVIDHGDGIYTAALPHPGVARTTVLTVTDGGFTARARLSVTYE